MNTLQYAHGPECILAERKNKESEPFGSPY